MRVISGEAKGRPLLGPAGTFTRPMQDKIKEALFSMLWSLGVEPAHMNFAIWSVMSCGEYGFVT